ncbi:MAG: hypothetical protein QXP70_00255 [Methanomassiliicoccales archaeon]
MEEVPKPLHVLLVTEDKQKVKDDIEFLGSLPGLSLNVISPMNFIMAAGGPDPGRVALLEFPFVNEDEQQFLTMLGTSFQHLPIVVVTADPLLYLNYTQGGRVTLVVREPGYRYRLLEAMRAARETATALAERELIRKRLEEYSHYLEMINKIMEHDIGDLNQAILTFSELLQRSQTPVNSQLVANIISEAKTVASLINSFSSLTHLAKGNVQDLSMESREMLRALEEGLEAFKVETGKMCMRMVEIPANIKVVADVSLPSLFKHAAAYVSTVNAEAAELEVRVHEGFALERTVSVTISPKGGGHTHMPATMKHLDDVDELLGGNVDLMSVMILSKRYGGTVSVNSSGLSNGGCSFLSISLPVAV